MKRKLLWVAVMFALGEVTYIFAGRVIQISIIFIMLICCVKKTQRLCIKDKILLMLMFVCGVLNIYFRDACDVVEDTIYSIPTGYITIKETKDFYIGSYSKNETDNYFITGRVVVTDKIQKEEEYTYVLKFEFMESKYGQINCNNKALVYGVTEDLVLGRKYYFEGKICLFNSETNPGGFDMRTYYKAKNIDFYLDDCRFRVDNNTSVPLFYRYKSFLLELKKSLSKRLEAFVSPDNVGVYKSILLGDKDNVSLDLKSLYRINGIAHILAISGLHISLIGGLLYKLLRKLGLGFIISGGISIFIIISYGIMTGGSNSTTRAVIMLVLSIFGEVLGRNYDMLTGMALALIILLVVNPYKLYDGGVILSFMAVVGVVVGRYICNLIFSKGTPKKIKKKNIYVFKLVNLLVVSLSVNSVTFPIIINLYYEIPLYSVFINVIVIPLFTLVVFCGIIALIASFYDVSLARVIIMPGEKIIEFYEELCKKLIEIPYSNVNIGKINIICIMLYYFLLLSFLYSIQSDAKKKIRERIYKKTGRWFNNKNINILIFGIYIFAFCLTFGFCYLWNEESKKECVCFLDVGQGDGILIRSENGVNIVIDGGSTSEQNIGEYVISPALKYMGMAKVEYWFVTHADIDHISGLLYILEMGKRSGIEVKNIVVSKYIYQDENLDNIIELAALNNVNIIYVDAGTSFSGEDFKIKVIFPYENYEMVNKNQASLVLEYTSNSMSMLFTGDIDKDVCEKVYERCIEDGVCLYDVLKIPHHGSRNSFSQELYSLTLNGHAVISCSINNIYGHPHEEVLTAITGMGIDLLMTKNQGAIVFYAY